MTPEKKDILQDQSTFQRAKHDKEHPFVMVSKEMIRDISVSPTAKFVLIFLLSYPDNWKIYHCNLQKSLNIGEHALNSAMDELIKAGYATRTRKKVNGRFMPYDYQFSELKLFVPDREIPAGEHENPGVGKKPPHDGLSQTGFTGPENPDILNTDIQREQTAGVPASAAVFSGSPEKEIYLCLRDLDMPACDKRWITDHYPQGRVIKSVEWASDPNNPPTKCLSAQIKQACKFEYELENPKEKPAKKSHYEELQKYFKNGNIYNGAECTLKPDGISFMRGQKHRQVHINQYFTWTKIADICKDFGIQFNRENQK